MNTAQPEDEWEFLPNDDEWEEPKSVPAEAAALHIERGTRPAAEDPGRSEVALGEGAPVEPQAYFDDEEPEDGARAADGDAPEPDLEDILEGQHYAFETEASEPGDEADRLPPDYVRSLLDDEERRLRQARVGTGVDPRAGSEAESLGELTDADQHPADTASETYEREKDLSLRDQIDARLEEVELARARLEDGTYGICERCHQPISAERLEARPATRWCTAHRAEAAAELG